MLVNKRKPPDLPPDERKRLRMVCAARTVGRGRPPSVSTSSFQDAKELLLDQHVRMGFYEKNPTACGEISQRGRPIVPRKTFDAYDALPAIKLIKKMSACNKDNEKGQYKVIINN